MTTTKLKHFGCLRCWRGRQKAIPKSSLLTVRSENNFWAAYQNQNKLRLRRKNPEPTYLCFKQIPSQRSTNCLLSPFCDPTLLFKKKNDPAMADEASRRSSEADIGSAAPWSCQFGSLALLLLLQWFFSKVGASSKSSGWVLSSFFLYKCLRLRMKLAGLTAVWGWFQVGLRAAAKECPTRVSVVYRMVRRVRVSSILAHL